MFSVFDVPNEFEGGIRIHFNFFLLGFGETISHGHPRWGLLIRAAAKAVARGNCSAGKSFGIRRDVSRFSRPSAEIPARSLQKVKNFQQRTRNCGYERRGERGWGKSCIAS